MHTSGSKFCSFECDCLRLHGFSTVLAIHVRSQKLASNQKSRHIIAFSFNRFDGQYVPITSQISKENFEVIKRVEIKRVRLWYVLFQFYRIFEFKLILAAELGCLGKFKRSNQILQCAEQQMFHRKCKKIRVSL